MTKKTAVAWKVGDLVAWESQAGGYARTKIGTISKAPKQGTDQRTSEGKYRINVLASYPISKESDIGKAKGTIRARTSQAEGRAGVNLLRVPTEAERAAVEL